MPRRQIFNDRQRAELLALPIDQTNLYRYYTLADDDIEYIQARRRSRNKFGFALQLCAFRYPGRLLVQGELIPPEITQYLSEQLGMEPSDLASYALRAETRREHLTDLRAIYGYRMFTGRGARELKNWLEFEASIPGN